VGPPYLWRIVKDILKLLVDLQKKDSLMLEKRRFIDRVPKRLSEVDAPLKQARLDLEQMKKKAEAIHTKKREKETALSGAQEKISKMKSRVSDIKTNKEYQAYQKEIEASEKEIFSIEDEVLQLMEEIDIISGEQKERESQVSEEMEKFDAFKNKLNAEMAGYETELDLLKRERSEMLSMIPADVYNVYMNLLRDSGDGIAVTPALNELCSGCDMNIPPQLFVEIRKNEEIIQCPQCRRILFAPEESQPVQSQE
jgi:uncharacterized protein